MARRKKSGSGGVVAAMVIGAIALLAAIPKEVWIGAGVLAAIGIAFYLYSQSKKAQVVVDEPEPQRLPSRSAGRGQPLGACPEFCVRGIA